MRPTSQPKIASAVLSELLREFAVDESSWAHHVRDVSVDPRAFSLVRATDEFDMWVVTWRAGAGIPLHDHGPSEGALRVLRGRLLETVAPTTRRDGAFAYRILDRGSGAAFAARHVHGVHNIADEAAVSVHAYSPPLQSMGFYDASGARTRVETSHGRYPTTA